ncbi:solute carrier family 22 member 6-like isoform 2-T2 [Trichechus inunguis]
MEVLQANLQKDLAMNQAQPSMSQLLRCPAIRHLSLPLLTVVHSPLQLLWCGHEFANFRNEYIYLIQILFTAVNVPLYFLTFLSTKSLGHRLTQMGSMLLSGICILACATVPLDQLFLRIAMAMLGKGCISVSLNCIIIYTGELYPTVMRALPLATSTITLLLPETLGQPLPNTLQDLENRWKQKVRQKQKEHQKVPLRPQHKRRMDSED